ncbi:TRAP transporter fused permease subunit [Paracoccus sp. MC1862]|uniref:TRAP transporter permease n=2 Tax=Paracoccus TaxID=265 RepID=UPI0016031F41|nr:MULTISPECIES: TRAP transporter fused permease subunit [unclassified Paracoccus (in: a-proteobacteria)]MBB1492857.1 TRAP transporter fused permease subunit [Paracoccus sp. MC1854]MBB1499506.1 TRAP transporter fused permease subunit [Paracoccus sp. MC1862]QQO45817.1 TRAP transporter fused permease subunit [Paracoccus sp. MC1862]
MHHSSDPPRPARPSGFALIVVYILGAAGVLLAINQVFLLNLFGFQPLGNSYLYYLIGVFLSIAFITMPSSPKWATTVPWFDWVLVVLTFGATLYLGNNGLRIIQEGWEFAAPLSADIAAVIVLVAALEGVRRGGGNILLCTALFFAAYPLFAGYMPGFLWGTAYSLPEAVRAHVLGVESIVGLPMQVVAELVIGFVIFGSVLTITKGSDFFMDLAAALLGRRRGGPAKVSVLSSGLLGSLSGSVISNILTTGPFTIPTMMRVGYSRTYAAAIEATASSGATLMPPVMGTVAFIMASFLGIPYAEVAIAAFLPAVLFYAALLFQVDLYAAREGLKGLPEEEIPPLGRTLISGWPYLLSLVVLIYVLMVMRLESYSPYFASLAMIIATSFNPRTRLNARRALDLLLDVAKNIGSLVAILAGIGLVVGGLSYTGVAGAFSRELLILAGGNVLLMLIAGALTSFILGLGMTVSAAYIFLSILLAPALVQAGLNPIGSHMFILYWGMLSYITPPVALASITAANIAKSDPFKTSLFTMRLGNAKFILPFIFIYDPALLMQGTWADVLSALVMALIALWALTVAFEAYLYRVGIISMVGRVLFTIGAILTIIPEFYTDVLGLVVIAIAIFYEWFRAKNQMKATT